MGWELERAPGSGVQTHECYLRPDYAGLTEELGRFSMCRPDVLIPQLFDHAGYEQLFQHGING